MKTFSLINKLNKMGVYIYLQNDGVRVKISGPVPPFAFPLLKELNIKRQDAINYLLQWDDDYAFVLFKTALKRLNHRYPSGALQWAMANRSDLVDAIEKAERSYDDSYRAKDMSVCQIAVANYEESINSLIKAYNLRQLSTDETISLLECSKVWRLPKHKLKNLNSF